MFDKKKIDFQKQIKYDKQINEKKILMKDGMRNAN